MKVIICGAGQVGLQIARHLAGEQNDVTVVDVNADLVRHATDTLDVQGVTGYASYPDVLKTAGAEDADMIIAATHSDEVNMVTCQVAHSIFNIDRKIARLRAKSYNDPEYGDLYMRDHLPIEVIISPEREVAEAAMRRLSASAAFDTEIFMDGKAQLLGLSIGEDCPLVNTALRQLTDLFSTLRSVVVGIRRNRKLFAPEPNDQVLPGDDCYIFCHSDDVERTLEAFGKSQRKLERMVIVGGGNVGRMVAHRLEESPGRVRAKMIERSRTTAEEAAEELERTIVLHGDGLDEQLLNEAGIARADAMLAVTNDDKTNILAAVRAKHAGCPMAIALINDPSLEPMMGPLGIDAHINPRATTVGSILRHIRHGRVKSVYSIGDSEAEIIEAEVLPTSPMAGARLRDVAFPEGALVGGVMKNGEVLRPSGGLRVEVGDTVAIFALSEDIPAVEQLMLVAHDYVL
ncbi:Trk system potassium transporter TrkA [Pukyongiella litopenaei]|uniref:Trk system potassium uptake protein TrkA n=1 Tax=Pukyongiella litopenaei TaxID=2605946 RepID=A0A2S0MU72_9RHOB|nr:Trk system potassium transporter TrkA [Pukyongiella litopenaei]AVO39450.1 Trk system potassium transporter TrkA [Pukyongiella litopenaei]